MLSTSQRIAVDAIRAVVPHLWTGLGRQSDGRVVLSLVGPDCKLLAWRISHDGWVMAL
jgi:hypothetical protein